MAIERGGVEIMDAGLEGSVDGRVAVLLRDGAVHIAEGGAAHPQLRHLDRGLANRALRGDMHAITLAEVPEI